MAAGDTTVGSTPNSADRFANNFASDSGRAEGKTRVLEFDIWILAFVDVGVRDSILARQRLIEFGEHLVRIDESLQLGPLDQCSLIPMPTITVNQILVQREIVSVHFLISSSAIDHIQSETGNSSTGGQMRAFGPTIPFPFGLVKGGASNEDLTKNMLFN